MIPISFSPIHVAPILCLTAVALLVLLCDAFSRTGESFSFWGSVAGIGMAMVICVIQAYDKGVPAEMMMSVGFGSFTGVLFLLSALMTIVLSREYFKDKEAAGEVYVLTLFATIGMLVISAAQDLIIIFVGIELMSICLYALAGSQRSRQRSNEAALKYFLLGAFATGFLLYGIALIYGGSGTTNLARLAQMYPELAASKLVWTGIGLFLVGLAFKIGAVPFHMWVPDVYDGSPTPVAGFMSTGAKAAAFSAALLVFGHRIIHGENLKMTIAVISACSMVLGNVVAVAQTSIKRMLAYSSIAHAGYMLIGIASASQIGRTGVLFYLTAYLFMNVGAFGVLSMMEGDADQGLTFQDYSGLARRRPYVAALMAVFMFSLSGIPPFAGFLGKYYVFAAAVNADLTWLAVLGVLASVIGVYYYLRLVVVMYFEEGGQEMPATSSPMLSLAVLTAAALAVIDLGVMPSSVLSVVDRLF